MVRRTKIILLGAAIGVATLALLVLTTNRGEPSYQGKPLSYWVRQLPYTIVQTNWSGPNYSERADTIWVSAGAQPQRWDSSGDSLPAVAAMGADALPFLIRRLRQSDTPSKLMINKYSSKIGIKRQPFDSAVAIRAQAVTALVELVPLSAYARQQLRSLTNDADPGVAASAKFILSGAAPAARFTAILVLPHPLPLPVTNSSRPNVQTTSQP